MNDASEATLRARVLEAGTQLGRYTIVRRIGSGGMAELYLARARGIGGFDKLLALKLVLPHVADDPEFVAMFLDEARLAATLDHANIAHVVDIGRVGNDHFYAMEYVHGLDLRAICKAAGGPLPIEVALTIVLGVAAGLHHAHERCGADGRPLGVVHRDVSPSNVLVTYDGVVKIVDFGIARAEARSKATQAGVVKGKRGYMSPEQCRGDGIDRRSDVFGLGILLWELTVGARLFAGDSDYAVMSKIVFGMVPDPRQLVPTYPPALAEITMRALQRDADDRPATAQALAVELEHFVQAAGLRTSNHLLADYVGSNFGSVPYPTVTAIDAVDEEAATRHVAARPRRARRLAPAAWFAAAAVVLGGGTWYAMRTPNEPLSVIVPESETPAAQALPAAPPPAAIVAAPTIDTTTPVDDDEPIVVDDAPPPAGSTRTPAARAPARGRRSDSGDGPRARPTAPSGRTDPAAPVPSRPNELFPPRE